MKNSSRYPYKTPPPKVIEHLVAQVQDDPDDDPGALAQAVDEALDACDDAWVAGDMGTARALLTAAMATCDALLEALGVDDPDEVGPDTDDPSEPGYAN